MSNLHNINNKHNVLQLLLYTGQSVPACIPS